MKKYLTILLLIGSFALINSGCGLWWEATEMAVGSAGNSFAQNRAEIKVYGKIEFIEDSMKKVETIDNSNNKLIIIKGKFKYTKGPEGLSFVDLRYNKFHYEFYDNKKKFVNEYKGSPILDQNVNRQSLDVNTVYNFRVEISVPSNQWMVISSHEFVGFN